MSIINVLRKAKRFLQHDLTKGRNRIGMNISSASYYNQGDHIYTDAIKYANAFLTPDGNYNPIACSPDGWPAADFCTGIIIDVTSKLSMVTGVDRLQLCPTVYGQYTCCFTGQGTIDFLGAGPSLSYPTKSPFDNTITLSATGYDSVNNVTYFYVNFGMGALFVNLKITNTKRLPTDSVGSGVTNLKVMLPGYDLHTTQKYTNEFIAYAKQLGILRLMGYMNSAMDRSNYNWKYRATPQTRPNNGYYGPTWEDVIDMANATGCDIWLNIPPLWDWNDTSSNNYVTSLAKLLKDKLSPTVNVYVELSNEVWNTSANEYALMKVASYTEAGVTSNNAYISSATGTLNTTGNVLTWVSPSPLNADFNYFYNPSGAVGLSVIGNGVTPGTFIIDQISSTYDKNANITTNVFLVNQPQNITTTSITLINPVTPYTLPNRLANNDFSSGWTATQCTMAASSYLADDGSTMRLITNTGVGGYITNAGLITLVNTEYKVQLTVKAGTANYVFIYQSNASLPGCGIFVNLTTLDIYKYQPGPANNGGFISNHEPIVYASATLVNGLILITFISKALGNTSNPWITQIGFSDTHTYATTIGKTGYIGNISISYLSKPVGQDLSLAPYVAGLTTHSLRIPAVSYRMAQAFASVYGANALNNNIRVILAWQAVSANDLNTWVTYMQTAYLGFVPSNWFYAYSVAPYNTAYGADLDANGYFNFPNENYMFYSFYKNLINYVFPSNIDSAVIVANSYNLKSVFYEGNPYDYGDNTVNINSHMLASVTTGSNIVTVAVNQDGFTKGTHVIVKNGMPVNGVVIQGVDATGAFPAGTTVTDISQYNVNGTYILTVSNNALQTVNNGYFLFGTGNDLYNIIANKDDPRVGILCQKWLYHMFFKGVESVCYLSSAGLNELSGWHTHTDLSTSTIPVPISTRDRALQKLSTTKMVDFLSTQKFTTDDPAPINLSLPTIVASSLNAGSNIEGFVGKWNPAAFITGFAIQFNRVNSSNVVTPIPGALYQLPDQLPIYKCDSFDVGFGISISIIASNSAGTTTVTSAKTGNIVAVTLTYTGIPQLTPYGWVGQTISILEIGWNVSPTSKTYQWYRVTAAGVRTLITGATNSAYTTILADSTYWLQCDISGTNQLNTVNLSTNKLYCSANQNYFDFEDAAIGGVPANMTFAGNAPSNWMVTTASYEATQTKNNVAGYGRSGFDCNTSKYLVSHYNGTQAGLISFTPFVTNGNNHAIIWQRMANPNYDWSIDGFIVMNQGVNSGYNSSGVYLPKGYLFLKHSDTATNLYIIKLTSASAYTVLATSGYPNVPGLNTVNNSVGIYFKGGVVISGGIVTLTFYASADGINWTQQFSTTDNTYLTAPSPITYVSGVGSGYTDRSGLDNVLLLPS